MVARPSLGWPITLGVVMIVLLVLLLIGWIIVSTFAAIESPNAAIFWTVLAVGTTFLILVLAGVVLYLLLTIKAIRLNQRQSNFIDSVTHELKSPIASLKLYLQTLGRRSVSEEQQADFYRFMLEDVQRLDALIDHLLDAARLDRHSMEGTDEEVDLAALLHRCAQTACQRYRLPPETIRMKVEPLVLNGRSMDLEMIFRNLIDNALKYSGPAAQIEIESYAIGQGRSITCISDNGPGIPAKLRRKIFGRFVRLGSELERSRTGTGLGLFIVRTLVTRMKGRVTVRGRAGTTGTAFEVELPGRIFVPTESEPQKQLDSADHRAADVHNHSSAVRG